MKVGRHFRHWINPFALNPLEWWRCMKIGYLNSVCIFSIMYPWCSEPHSDDTCRATVFMCGASFRGPHDAVFKDCRRLKSELAVLKQMTRNNSTQRETTAMLRRRVTLIESHLGVEWPLGRIPQLYYASQWPLSCLLPPHDALKDGSRVHDWRSRDGCPRRDTAIPPKPCTPAATKEVLTHLV